MLPSIFPAWAMLHKFWLFGITSFVFFSMSGWTWHFGITSWVSSPGLQLQVQKWGVV
jgi:hypothetical protein